MKLNRYQTVAITTVFATLFLILVGGLVRASGAGLGCPDWPKCYGLWIPPMSVDTLPSEYHPSEFNALKTWTEYVNRLIGVVIGLLITATFLLSFNYLKKRPVVTIASFLAFIGVIFQGWLGGQVVRSGLHEGIITLHMIMAMIIVGLLIYASFKAVAGEIKLQIDSGHRKTLLIATTLLLAFTMAQMILGTQVREAIDLISRGVVFVPREEWLSGVGLLDEIHRSFSWTVLIITSWMTWYIKKESVLGYFCKLNLWIFILIISQIVVGIVLAYAGMPASFQVLHLFGSAVMISLILLKLFSLSEAQTD